MGDIRRNSHQEALRGERLRQIRRRSPPGPPCVATPPARRPLKRHSSHLGASHSARPRRRPPQNGERLQHFRPFMTVLRVLSCCTCRPPRPPRSSCLSLLPSSSFSSCFSCFFRFSCSPCSSVFFCVFFPFPPFSSFSLYSKSTSEYSQAHIREFRRNASWQPPLPREMTTGLYVAKILLIYRGN